MIICPNTGDECTKLVKPLVRTAFLIISYDKKNEKIRKIKETIIASFKRKGYNVTLAEKRKQGRNLYCKICQQIQAVPVGVVAYTKETPINSFPNIFFELGVMTSFGKEIILLKDYNIRIPSDLHGLEWTPFKDLEDLEKQLSEQIEQFKETADYYIQMGNIYREKGDFEKTINYYKRAYLLFPKDAILDELRELLEELEKVDPNDKYYALSVRLRDNLKHFLTHVK